MTRYKREMIKRGKIKVNKHQKINTARNSLIITSIILLVGIVVLWIII